MAFVLAMTLVVRDEEEILASNLDYHLAQGVDVVLAVDHGSTDGRPEILRKYERLGRLRWFQADTPGHDQARRVGRLLAVAAHEYRADWVIHGDADEFWMPTAGSLRDVFEAIPDRYGYVKAQRHDFLPVAESQGPFHQRMVVRHRTSLSVRCTVLDPKVAQRPAAATVVEPGNHDLESPVMPLAPDIGAVEVLHFPMRSFEQFERKVLRNGVGHELREDRPPLIGHDQLELLARQRRGELRDHYEAQLRSTDVITDRRLQAFMAAGPLLAGEAPAARELLAHTWAGVLIEIELEERIEALERELSATRDELAELGRTLEAVRASRVMRLTEPLRRMYYRVGGGANGGEEPR